MATSSLLAIQCAGFDGEGAGHSKKHSFADKGADRLKKQKLAACPCDGRVLAGDEGAKPKTRMSKKDALFIAGAYDKIHANKLVNAGMRVASLKKELQEARGNWKSLENSYCYITHMNTKDAQLKIRLSKKETFTHARVPDAETVARLETALQRVADLKTEVLCTNVAALQIRPSKKKTCAPTKSVNEEKTLNTAKPDVAGTAKRGFITRAAAKIAVKEPSTRLLKKILKNPRWGKRGATLQLKQEVEREAKRLCGEEPFPANLTGSPDNQRAARLASIQNQIACLEEKQSATLQLK